MTPARDAGLVIGKSYEVTGGDEHGFAIGSIVEFAFDDKTIQPKFKGREDDHKNGYPDDYIYIHNVKPVDVPSSAKFEETSVTQVITTITIPRALTEAERDAIRKIVGV